MELPRSPPTPKKPILVGTFWMVGLSLLLFFVPLINGLIGGLVGGYKVGSTGRALAAAVAPAALVAAGLWVLFAIADAPALGVLAGAAVGVVIALSEVGLFIGAAIGGAASHSRRLAA